MTEPVARLFSDVDEVISRFDAHDYLLDVGTASAIYLAAVLGRPLLLEGEPGVGKTTAAKTLAAVLDAPLLRLQCYEGLTASEALYDWNYQRQLLSIRLAEARGAGIDESDQAIIGHVLDSYQHTNALALVVLSALLAHFEPRPADPVSAAETAPPTMYRTIPGLGVSALCGASSSVRNGGDVSASVGVDRLPAADENAPPRIRAPPIWFSGIMNP